MLAWELELPDEHGYHHEMYERMLEQDFTPEVDPPVLDPANERAYCALKKLFRVTERDGWTGQLRLNYTALKDFVGELGCGPIDREKIFDAWPQLRHMDAERGQRRANRGDEDWEKKKREFLNS